MCRRDNKTRRPDPVLASAMTPYELPATSTHDVTKVAVRPTTSYVSQVAQLVAAQLAQPLPPKDRLLSLPFPPLLTAENREMARLV